MPKAHGLTQTDQKGMLDTARNTHFAKMQQPTLSPNTEIETELLRRATAWNAHANPPKSTEANPEIRTTTTPQAPKSPPNAREHFPKRRQQHQAPPHKEPPTNPPRRTHGRAQDNRQTKEQNRVTRSNVLLAQFHQAPRPVEITKHLHTTNDPEEL